MMFTKLICLTLLSSVMFAGAARMASATENIELQESSPGYCNPNQCPCKNYEEFSDESAFGGLIDDAIVDLLEKVDDFDSSPSQPTGFVVVPEADLDDCFKDAFKEAINSYYDMGSDLVQLSDSVGFCGEAKVRCTEENDFVDGAHAVANTPQKIRDKIEADNSAYELLEDGVELLQSCSSNPTAVHCVPNRTSMRRCASRRAASAARTSPPSSAAATPT